MKRLTIIVVASFISALAQTAVAHAAPISVIQGDPVIITITGVGLTSIKSAEIAGSPVYFTSYRGVPTALYGTDINQKTGPVSVSVTFIDGSVGTSSFVIERRVKPTEALPIPDQLGGNSETNQQAVVTALSKENAEIASVYSRTDRALWTDVFSFPTASTSANPRVITDPYGYNRDSGVETITHKGVDFRAPPGTPVYAVNRGIVRTAKAYTVYGNTVIIDHGLGLLSMYMHLSKITVGVGQLVEKGQLVGYSGTTGYSEGPHLHLTIRIGGVSIDPMKFYALFGVK